MKVTFAYDKKARKLYFKVRHANISETEFSEVFSGAVVVIGQKSRMLKAVGRTHRGRFLTAVFIRVSDDHFHVITGWPSSRRQIVLWHREMNRR